MTERALMMANSLLSLSACASADGFTDVAHKLLALIDELPLPPNTVLSQKPLPLRARRYKTSVQPVILPSEGGAIVKSRLRDGPVSR